MKINIHPKFFIVNVFCSCGNIMKVKSTVSKDINLDVCGNCHPFYTGKQRFLDSGGRIEKFNKKFDFK